jgi:hypothetical protein
MTEAHNLLSTTQADQAGVDDGTHMFKMIVVTPTLLGTLSACSLFGGARVHSDYVGTAALNQDQVTRLLNEQGYTDISGLHKNGTDWIGSAVDKGGQQVNFDIDKGGQIHTK